MSLTATSQNTTIEVPVNALENMYRADLKCEALRVAFASRGLLLDNVIKSQSNSILQLDNELAKRKILEDQLLKLQTELQNSETKKPQIFWFGASCGAIAIFVLSLVFG